MFQDKSFVLVFQIELFFYKKQAQRFVKRINMAPRNYNLTRATMVVILLLNLISLGWAYIDIPLTIQRPKEKTGEIAYNFKINLGGYFQNVSVSLNNVVKDAITSQRDMKVVYKEKKLKKVKSTLQKNPKNVFGEIEATSLEGYTFEGWKRFFIEAFMYIQSRYYHTIQINLDDAHSYEQKQSGLTNGVMTLGPKLNQNKIYQQIKKNTAFIEFDIIAIYSGMGERSNRIQLGGYQESYAKGDIRTGALLYEFPLHASGDYWQLGVQKILFGRSKDRSTQSFLLNPSRMLFRLSLQSEYIIFPQSMRSALQQFVQSQNNECSMRKDYLECKNMSTLDISSSQFAFQLTPNYFINISLYDLRRQYDADAKKFSFYIKLAPEGQQDTIQIGSTLLKNYYIVIDMNQQTLLYSPVNRFREQFSSVYALRFFVYFAIFTIIMAVIVVVWANLSDPSRRNKVQYGKQGIQLITYHRPGSILTHNQFDD